MKYTLLDLTQQILSSLDSDEVNSIGDTTESRQVANVVRQSYFNIIARANLTEHEQLFQLEPSLDPDTPVLMYRPANVVKLEWIKYDISEEDDATKRDYQYVTILPLEQFLEMINQFDWDESNVDHFTLNDFLFYFKTDKMPQYCTILNDRYIIFDSYNIAYDTTLQETKTQCFGQVAPTFLMEDNFIPALDELQFPLLLNEAKALAFLELKQIAHNHAVRESRLQWQSMQHSKYLKDEHPFHQLPNFGKARPRAKGLNSAIKL